jgi:hypothetical protein
MRRRTALALWCIGLLSLPVFAADAPKTPTCCAKKAGMKAEKAGKLRCSLTGKVVDKCCCVQREGKTYCTLAKKSVEKCCCTEVKGEGAEAKS